MTAAVTTKDSTREFAFEKADFKNVQQMLFKKAGINLSDAKEAMVYSRLARRIRARNLRSFNEYLALVNTSESELEQFINALTTNLTSFFREPHHFTALSDYLRQHNVTNIWCAASSTGEEPYSIAMVVAEAFGSFKTPVKIIASDIDSKVLAKARAGVYPLASIAKIPQHQQKQFFHKGKGANEGKVKVVDELRNMVQFKKLNLTEAKWDVKGPLDVIFCRNVMIYFDKPTQLKVLQKMVGMLKPTGLYMAGHSENFNMYTNLVRPVGKTIYRPVD
ncbi:chemotaxis protein CheR [Alteromonas sp. BL110]|uniref:CheR family methyltransferase n=1 Tax=Alteromonas sp. BL110 TaxID=1714845 RepID=UPI000E4C9B6B|nr:CheR family methyltransferase [Alteromonas sp. BL110]AXT38265.1 chemotaxis protein CheR [Alteromonas sp. BL110]RKM83991.1 chemotaxis protein CheR [Alteromonas sp. BL110]